MNNAYATKLDFWEEECFPIFGDFIAKSAALKSIFVVRKYSKLIYNSLFSQITKAVKLLNIRRTGSS